MSSNKRDVGAGFIPAPIVYRIDAMTCAYASLIFAIYEKMITKYWFMADYYEDC